MDGAVVLPAPPSIWTPDSEAVGERLRLPRWARPWERTKEDVAEAAYALVGAAGAASTGALGGAVTPAYGQTPTAGNLLVLTGQNTSSTATPALPAGWSSAINTQNGTIFYKIAAGGDAAPSLGAVAGATWVASLAEFSGNATVSPFYLSAATSGAAAASITATFASADPTSTVLMVISGQADYSVASALNLTHSSNHVTALNTLNAVTGTTTVRWKFSYGITNSNASADTAVQNQGTTNLTSSTVVSAIFLLPLASRRPVTVLQAVMRAATR